jgi:quinol monooxygenase YgiN
MRTRHTEQKRKFAVRYFAERGHPLSLVIYEVYRSKEDFLLHGETQHSVKWKTETKSMMAKPRGRFRGHAVYFSD